MEGSKLKEKEKQEEVLVNKLNELTFGEEELVEVEAKSSDDEGEGVPKNEQVQLNPKVKKNKIPIEEMTVNQIKEELKRNKESTTVSFFFSSLL